MSWVYLVLAGLFEIGWPVGLKMAQVPATRVAGIAVAVFFMGVSGLLLWLAQRTIPIGTAYAIWTGIGTVGTVIFGIVALNEPASALRLGCIAMIIGEIRVTAAQVIPFAIGAGGGIREQDAAIEGRQFGSTIG
eukprot:gene52778-64488_t